MTAAYSPWRDGLTPEQVAAQIGVSKWTVIRRIKAGELKADNVGGGGKGARWRVSPAVLTEWLAQVAA